MTYFLPPTSAGDRWGLPSLPLGYGLQCRVWRLGGPRRNEAVPPRPARRGSIALPSTGSSIAIRDEVMRAEGSYARPRIRRRAFSVTTSEAPTSAATASQRLV